MTDVTQILSEIEHGDPAAAERLLPLVYDELRKLAAAKLAHEKPGQTLQATALVHEAYLQLVDGEKAQHWNSRGHFFAAAAESMRRILVDLARRKQRPKHGGDRQRVELDDVGCLTDERPTSCCRLTQHSKSWRRNHQKRPNWSSCDTLPGCHTRKPRNRSESHAQPPTATGLTQKCFSAAKWMTLNSLKKRVSS